MRRMEFKCDKCGWSTELIGEKHYCPKGDPIWQEADAAYNRLTPKSDAGEVNKHTGSTFDSFLDEEGVELKDAGEVKEDLVKMNDDLCDEIDKLRADLEEWKAMWGKCNKMLVETKADLATCVSALEFYSHEGWHGPAREALAKVGK